MGMHLLEYQALGKKESVSAPRPLPAKHESTDVSTTTYMPA